MLERAERKGHAGRIAELSAKLAQPEFPAALHYLWRIFRRIRRRKGAGMSGPSPIEFPDLDAFQRASRVRLAPWEVEVIEALDDLFLKSADDRRAEQDTAPVDDPNPIRDMPRRTVIRPR